MSARGRSSRSERSGLVRPLTWLGQRPRESSAGKCCRRVRSVDGFGAYATPAGAGSAVVSRGDQDLAQVVTGSAASHSARVSGRWIRKSERLRGGGSSRLVEVVTSPLLRYRNGRGPRGGPGPPRGPSGQPRAPAPTP